MAEYGMRIWDENGKNIFNENAYGLQVLDTFYVTSSSGSRYVSGLNSSCILQIGYKGGIAVIENIYISGSYVKWQGTRLDGYDEHRDDVTIYVTVLKRR